MLRARMRGQPAPSLTQPYRHLAKLLRKTTLVPDTATDMFTFWPLAAFIAFAVVTMLIPSFCTGMLTAGASDDVTVIGLFALGRVAMMLGGLETGSALGGAGVARMALSSLCTDATLLVLLLIFALITQSTNLDQIVLAFAGRQVGLFVSMGFALAAMLLVACLEIGHNPATGQDLAMGQDRVTGEYSGRLLALLDYAAMLRLLAWMNLVICIFIPFGMARAGSVLSWPEGLLLWGVKLLCLSLGLALFTTIRADISMRRVPMVLGLALCLGLLGSLLSMILVKAGP